MSLRVISLFVALSTLPFCAVRAAPYFESVSVGTYSDLQTPNHVEEKISPTFFANTYGTYTFSDSFVLDGVATSFNYAVLFTATKIEFTFESEAFVSQQGSETRVGSVFSRFNTYFNNPPGSIPYDLNARISYSGDSIYASSQAYIQNQDFDWRLGRAPADVSSFTDTGSYDVFVNSDWSIEFTTDNQAWTNEPNYDYWGKTPHSAATVVLTLELTPRPVSSVPDAGSTAALLGLALTGLLAARTVRRRES